MELSGEIVQHIDVAIRGTEKGLTVLMAIAIIGTPLIKYLREKQIIAQEKQPKIDKFDNLAITAWIEWFYIFVLPFIETLMNKSLVQSLDIKHSEIIKLNKYILSEQEYELILNNNLKAAIGILISSSFQNLDILLSEYAKQLSEVDKLAINKIQSDLLKEDSLIRLRITEVFNDIYDDKGSFDFLLSKTSFTRYNFGNLIIGTINTVYQQGEPIIDSNTKFKMGLNIVEYISDKWAGFN